MIADGKYEATLFDADFCVTNAGTPAISFVWETKGTNLHCRPRPTT